jgi:hypothetical protein
MAAADDKDDSSPQDDPMGPPKEPCECWCMHCRRTFTSDQMWFQRVIGDSRGFEGFWMCPTANCSGAGFGFDIFPTDPNHPANEGWHHFDDDDEEEEDDHDEFEYDPELEDDLASDIVAHSSTEVSEWDPDEKKWKQLDADLGEDADADDDLDGEEWKFGLQPGERPPEPDWMEQARREREEEERQFDEPDRRPRELDWSDREDRRGQHPAGDGPFTDDDIPF